MPISEGEYQRHCEVAEQAEGRPGVVHMNDADGPLVGDGLAVEQIGADEMLGYLVGDEYGSAQGEKEGIAVPRGHGALRLLLGGLHHSSQR